MSSALKSFLLQHVPDPVLDVRSFFAWEDRCAEEVFCQKVGWGEIPKATLLFWLKIKIK